MPNGTTENISSFVYWTSPDTITAYSTLLLVVATIILAWMTWKYVSEVRSQAGVINQQAKSMKDQADAMKRQADVMDKQSKFIKDQSDAMTSQARTMEAQFDIIREESATMKRQADAMEGQSSLMRENMEHDRLSKRYERLIKEMTLLIGPLYARRKEKFIFEMVNRSERYGTHLRDVQNAKHYDYVTFWDTIDRYLYLNQSSELSRALGNYNQAIYHNFYFLDQKMEPERLTNMKLFQDNTVPFLIKTIEERHDQLDKEIKELEVKLKIGANI